jgi:hypothetical protein
MLAQVIARWRQDVESVATEQIIAAVNQLDPIGLDELDAVRLLDRVDTKFLLRDWQLLDILRDVGAQYRVLSATPDRINRYRTLYFDTEDLLFYHQHHNDFHPRYKVRCREYVDSGMYFMEIKCKTNRRRTVKQRMPTPAMVQSLTGEARDFVGAYCPVDVDRLMPCILNEFARITLVSKTMPERLTIDVNYRHMWHNRAGGLPGLVIAEVKQPKFSQDSAFVRELRAHSIRKMGFSKYCTGIMELYPHVRYNRFKRRFIMLERLSRQRGNL